MQTDPIQIVPFDDRYIADFDRLNRAWLEPNGLLEPLDESYLADPRTKILDAGGEVFFAMRADVVIGTAAAIPWSTDVMELAKLTVMASARGGGVGEQLIAQVIAFARARGAVRVVLTSNAKLRTAVALYRRLGFQDRPVPSDVGYESADVYMELELAQ